MKKEIIKKLKQINVLNLKNQNYQKEYDSCINVFKIWCNITGYPYCVESFYCFLEEFGTIKLEDENSIKNINSGLYLFHNLHDSSTNKFLASGLSELIKRHKYDKLDEYTTNMVTE